MALDDRTVDKLVEAQIGVLQRVSTEILERSHDDTTTVIVRLLSTVYDLTCRKWDIDSPIEKLFLLAWLPQLMDPDWFIKPQSEIGSYRVDFICGLRRFDGTREVVVECDGHDFHEKTKQQAQHDKKRDRYLQSKGYTVLHFTGSEIWRDPFDCVNEVIRFLRGAEGP